MANTAMDFEGPVGSGKTKAVIGIVIVGIVVLGVAAFVVIKKRTPTAEAIVPTTTSQEAKRWCEIRQEWARKVNPMAGDILLKSVQNKAEAEKLNVARNKLCQQYAKKVRDLKVADSKIRDVEVALIKEGKVRANVAVEISNLLAQLGATDISSLRESSKKLKTDLKLRIMKGVSDADSEVKTAMAELPGCHGIYRGPMTDEATADNPYLSWDELEFRRKEAIKSFDKKITELAPLEEWTNLVYHKLVARYRKELKSCYAKAKARNKSVSQQLGLRVRLKRDGGVKTLAIEWMEVRDPKLLDCFLKHAGKWKLPRPMKADDFVVVTLDFTTI